MKKVLLVIESCNPELSSVPLVGFNFFKAIDRTASVHLVTHCRNKDALTRYGVNNKVTYYEETKFEKIYYKIIAAVTSFKGRTIWPLRHLLQFPIYFLFDRFVYSTFSDDVSRGKYDIVHAMTPILPRFPYKISRACKTKSRNVPFVMGPVNGGVPYPEAFKAISNREFGYLNWLRKLGALLVPGYRKTYCDADKILAGSTYTANWIKQSFPEASSNVHLMYENGVPDSFYSLDDSHKDGVDFRLLFIGRLEPYKGCDMLLEAFSKIPAVPGRNLKLTIVGDGSEKRRLEEISIQLNIRESIEFLGWMDHSKVQQQCTQSNLFCFPSVREFGGAVVMEAMAAGLPCIVVDNGGIGEYVTEECGVKLTPTGRSFVVDHMAREIGNIASNPDRYNSLAKAARERSKYFSWNYKAKELANIYDQLVETGIATQLESAS